MPEGDTVHKIARYLRERIEGRRIESGSARDRPEVKLGGLRIERVRAHGKHLFLELEGGLVVRSHLGMRGSWHRYPAGLPWQRPREGASLILQVEGQYYALFRAEEVEILRAGSVREREIRSRLGPDLTAGEVDFGQVLARARRFSMPEDPVVDLLLDQRVSAGIGNVYKSEVLFLEAVHPRTPVGRLVRPALLRLYERASGLLRRNVRPGPRATRFEGDANPLWVYRRRGLPCLRCGTPILHARLGRTGRSTYWCPRCQPFPSSSSDASIRSTSSS